MHLYLEHMCYLSLFCVNEERLSRLQEEMIPKTSLEQYKRRLAHSFLLTTFKTVYKHHLYAEVVKCLTNFKRKEPKGIVYLNYLNIEV
jgi:hypothetical protein